MSGFSRSVWIVVLTVCLVVGLCEAARAQDGGWWKSDWKARRIVRASVPEGVEADEPLAVASFMTHGYLKSDGSDVRVVARGREVPRRVLHVGPGDEVTVAFQLLVGVDRYQVYYGNPQAGAPDDDWEIRAGLLLEVREYRGGGINSLVQARTTWQGSKDVLGADFVPNVYFGHNPFGPSRSFMARYSGWLRVDKPGRYVFYTTSSNASFLLIDDREVVSWPGWHPPVRRARHGGSIELKAGRCRFEYLHIHPSGSPTAVAAWQPPGERRPRVIPAWAFLPVARAVVQPAEVYRQPVTPDFDYKRYEAVLDPTLDTCVYRYGFRDLTLGLSRQYYRPLWDFGDGNTSNVWEPSHVYLVGGTYTLTYQLKGTRGGATTTQRIVVEPDWARQASDQNVETLEKYYAAVKGYDFPKMSPEALRAARQMFDRLRKYDDVVRVGRILLFEKTDVSDGVLFSETEHVARTYLEKLRDATSAVEVYLNGEKRVTSVDWKAALLTRGAAVVLEGLDDVDRARGYYRRVLETYPKAKAQTRRRALVGLAETAILTGQADEARKRLHEAEAMEVQKSEQGGAAVRVGSLSRAVEDYIRRNEFAAARDLLDTWEWEYPLDRLVGYSTLLRAKLCMRREEYPRALRLLTSLVKVNPKSNYAAEALLTAGECYLRLGDKSSARDTYKRVLSEYPESPHVKEALGRIEGLK